MEGLAREGQTAPACIRFVEASLLPVSVVVERKSFPNPSLGTCKRCRELLVRPSCDVGVATELSRKGVALTSFVDLAFFVAEWSEITEQTRYSDDTA